MYIEELCGLHVSLLETKPNNFKKIEVKYEFRRVRDKKEEERIVLFSHSNSKSLIGNFILYIIEVGARTWSI